MTEGLTAKQRDTVFRHWSSQMAQEGRDMAGLERVGARALQDRQVHADAPLQNMIRVALERLRAELRRETERDQRTLQATSPPKYQGDSLPLDAGSPHVAADCGPAMFSSPSLPSSAPAPPSPPPDPDQAEFSLAVERLGTALKAGDEDAARKAFADIRALHERRGDVVSAGYLEKCEQSVSSLRTQLIEHRRRVAALAAEAVAAAGRGDAPAVADLIRRLNAIHAAHPRLLDDAGYEQMRLDVAQANESREDQATTRKLMEREHAVAGEMRRLASAVFDFHAAVFGHPGSRAQFHHAAQVYLRAVRQTRLLDKDWLAEFVLEMGDVLANWNAPPPGAEEQIGRFLERLREALQRINTKMSDIQRQTRRSRRGRATRLLKLAAGLSGALGFVVGRVKAGQRRPPRGGI
jgi:hypothetical protein